MNKGDKVLSRTGVTEGVVATGNRIHCRLEGCGGSCYTVRWPDGATSKPCVKGMEWIEAQKVWQII